MQQNPQERLTGHLNALKRVAQAASPINCEYIEFLDKALAFSSTLQPAQSSDQQASQMPDELRRSIAQVQIASAGITRDVEYIDVHHVLLVFMLIISYAEAYTLYKNKENDYTMASAAILLACVIGHLLTICAYGMYFSKFNIYKRASVIQTAFAQNHDLFPTDEVGNAHILHSTRACLIFNQAHSKLKLKVTGGKPKMKNSSSDQPVLPTYFENFCEGSKIPGIKAMVAGMQFMCDGDTKFAKTLAQEERGDLFILADYPGSKVDECFQTVMRIFLLSHSAILKDKPKRELNLVFDFFHHVKILFQRITAEGREHRYLKDVIQIRFINYYIANEEAVCRHQTTLLAKLIDKAIMQGFLSGEVTYRAMQTKDSTKGHAWLEYRSPFMPNDFLLLDPINYVCSPRSKLNAEKNDVYTMYEQGMPWTVEPVTDNRGQQKPRKAWF